MRHFFTLCLTILFLSNVQSLYAQQPPIVVTGTITGVVRDTLGHAIPNASVKIKGKNKSIKADENGNFTLTAPTGQRLLLISCVGFETQQKELLIKAHETQTLDFILKKGDPELDEVVISASRREESLSATPSSVTVLRSKEINALARVSPNIANILSYAVPGLGSQTNNTGNYGQTLRGRNMLILIDGIPQSTPLKSAGREVRSIDPSVIERVEVIKGATAIYGNGADGGLINYITKKSKVQRNVAGYTQAGISGNTKGGNSIGYRFSQQLLGKINKFDYVVSGMYEQTGVFHDSNGEVISPEYGLGETKIYNTFAKVGYDLTENQRFELMYNYYSSNQNSDYILQNGVYGQRPAIGVRGNRLGVNEGTRYNHNANLQYTNKNIFGNTSLTANAYLQDFLTFFSYSAFFYEGGQTSTGSAKKGIRANLNTPFSLSSKIDGNITYGFDLLNDITHQTLTDGRVWVPKMNMRNLAPYAQLSTQWLNDLTLKAGVRAENMNINIADYNTIAKGPNGAGGIAVKGGELDYNALVFNAGARYSKYKFFNPFISYSQSFSIFDLGRVLTAAKEDAISKLQTKPIIVESYEAGFSSELGKVILSAAAYLSTSELGSNTIQTETGLNVSERLPERVWGYEFQVDYRVLNVLTVGGNYAYVQGRGDKDANGDFYGDNDIYLKSNRITPVKITAYAKFENSKLNVNLYWMHIGSRDLFKPTASGVYALGEGPIKAFDLWNLSTSYKVTSQFLLNLGVENLLNTNYYPTTSQFYGSNANYTAGNGRRFNLSLGYRF